MANDPSGTPEDDHEAKAKGRFMMINAMRIGGLLMILAGIAVLQDVLPLPMWTAYLLLVLGMVEMFVFPRFMARMWSTNDRNPPAK